MLTDVFFRRYETRQLFNAVGPKEKTLFVQAYRLIDEQIWKYYGYDKKVDETVKETWKLLHDRLSMEIGIKELSPVWYSYTADWMGKPHTYSGSYEWNTVVESWLNLNFADNLDPDMFVKRRLSFIELAFREREHQLAVINAMLPNTLQSAAFQDASPRRGLTIPGVNPKTYVERAQEQNKLLNDTFAWQVHELNTRFEQAGVPLHYHNGFIQITQDALLQAQVEQPFWDLVRDPRWKNVDIDMKEALDRRDTGGRDPSFYAAKALESTIKIISDEKGWTRGTETGVGGYLNNLTSKANGSFIAPWEHESMQRFYTDVRNDLGHGPGSEQMPKFTDEQIDFSIEFCMSWIKSLISRL